MIYGLVMNTQRLLVELSTETRSIIIWYHRLWLLFFLYEHLRSLFLKVIGEKCGIVYRRLCFSKWVIVQEELSFVKAWIWSFRIEKFMKGWRRLFNHFTWFFILKWLPWCWILQSKLEIVCIFIIMVSFILVKKRTECYRYWSFQWFDPLPTPALTLWLYSYHTT